MAITDTNGTDLARAEIFWKTADTLRGQVGAAEYKHVVLGLGAEAQEDDGEPFAEKYPRLVMDLEACVGEGERLIAVARERLKAVGHAE
jgi:hypothetical protein